jgi:hypothetical protein
MGETIFAVFVILLIHWIADFVLQTNYQAQNKSSSNKALTLHVVVYTVVTTILWAVAFGSIGEKGLIVLLATFCSHWITDYITSRVNKKLWEKKQVHDFFVSIGFDQLLHFAQLFITFYIINNIK